MTKHTTIIGIDCAVKDRNMGLALAEYSDGTAKLSHAASGKTSPVAANIAEWIEAATGPVLLALDAPLGWPEPLGAAAGP